MWHFILFLLFLVPASGSGESPDLSRDKQVRERFEALADEYGFELRESAYGLEAVDPSREAVVAARIRENRALAAKRLAKPKKLRAPSVGYQDRVKYLRRWFYDQNSPNYAPSKSELAPLMGAILEHQEFVWSTGTKGLLTRAMKFSAGEGSNGVLVYMKNLPQEEVTPGVVEAFLKVLKAPNRRNTKALLAILGQVNCSKSDRRDGASDSVCDPAYKFSIRIDPETNFEKLEPIIELANSFGEIGAVASAALARTGLVESR